MGLFDYIVVGAGSAGGPLVYRLSEDPSVRVLLIEAGDSRHRLFHRIPAGSLRMMGDPTYDWIYHAEPDPTADGRRVQWSGGKGLGGSSLINGMVYVRGSRHDYDDWLERGCRGWGFEDVLPYFRKMETYFGRQDESHGSAGPIGVSRMRTPHPAASAFIEAAGQMGLPIRDDYSDGNLYGAFPALGTIRNGLRSSTRDGYIRAAIKRPNVRVVTRAHAERILFSGGRATGVRVQRGGGVEEFHAQREVILSCGALQSPLLLMRSGIGEAAELRKFGISVIKDLPGVGRNLQEHVGTGTARRLNIPSYNVQVGPIDMIRHAIQFALKRDGAFTSAAGQALAYFKTDESLPEPDFSLVFVPLLISYNAKPPQLLDIAGVAFGGVLCKPASRGRIRLRDANPSSKPIIDFPMLGDRRDVDRLVKIFKVAESLWDMPALSKLTAGTLVPPPANDAEIEAYIRASAGIGYHAVGTCKMGTDTLSVVGPDLRVHGVDNLRIIDASIMPRIISGNTNAAAIMIGERGSDLIRHS